MARLVRNMRNAGKAIALLGQVLAKEVSSEVVSSAGVRERFAKVDRMTGTEFERFVTDLFKALGWPAEHRGRPGDGGADVLVKRPSGHMAVQCKCHGGGKRAGVEGVREVYAAKNRLGTPYALVVTNQRFTKAAKDEAALFDIELWDRDELGRRIAIAYTDVTPLKAWLRVGLRFVTTVLLILVGCILGLALLAAMSW